MKYTYRFINGDSNEIEISDDWSHCVLEFDRMDHNSERKDHRSDRKYHNGLPISLEEAESSATAQMTHKHGMVDADTLSNAVLQKLECERLHDAIGQLLPDQQDLVRAVFFGHCKAADYARLHNTSRAAISQRLNRALAQLKKLLS